MMDADQMMHDIRTNRSWEATFASRWTVFANRLAASMQADNVAYAAANPGGRPLNTAAAIEGVRAAPADRDVAEFRMRIAPA